MDETIMQKMVRLSVGIQKFKEREREQREKAFEENKKKRELELMTHLTRTCYNEINDAILKAAENGKREKYMNFNRDDCKANFPTLGKPSQVLTRWLEDITSPNSQYAPMRNGKVEHLAGLKFDVWNNKTFTVHFSW